MRMPEVPKFDFNMPEISILETTLNPAREAQAAIKETLSFNNSIKQMFADNKMSVKVPNMKEMMDALTAVKDLD